MAINLDSYMSMSKFSHDLECAEHMLDALYESMTAIDYIRQQAIYKSLNEDYDVDAQGLLIESSSGKGFFGTIWQKIKDFWRWIGSWFARTNDKVTEAVEKKIQEKANEDVAEAIKKGWMNFDRIKEDKRVWFNLKSFSDIANGFSKFTSTIKSDLDEMVKTKKAIIYKHYSGHSTSSGGSGLMGRFNYGLKSTFSKYVKGVGYQDYGKQNAALTRDADVHARDYDFDKKRAKPSEKYEVNNEYEADISVRDKDFVQNAINQMAFRAFKYSFGNGIFVIDKKAARGSHYLERLTFSSTVISTTLSDEQAEDFVKNVSPVYKRLTTMMGDKLKELETFVQKSITDIEREAFRAHSQQIQDDAGDEDAAKAHAIYGVTNSRNTTGGVSGALHGQYNNGSSDTHNTGMQRKLFLKFGKLLSLDEFLQVGREVYALVRKLYEKIIQAINNNLNILKSCLLPKGAEDDSEDEE